MSKGKPKIVVESEKYMMKKFKGDDYKFLMVVHGKKEDLVYQISNMPAHEEFQIVSSLSAYIQGKISQG